MEDGLRGSIQIFININLSDTVEMYIKSNLFYIELRDDILLN